MKRKLIANFGRGIVVIYLNDKPILLKASRASITKACIKRALSHLGK